MNLPKEKNFKNQFWTKYMIKLNFIVKSTTKA